jgi:hypothetical protein
MSDYRWGLDWQLDSLYSCNLELQVTITFHGLHYLQFTQYTLKSSESGLPLPVLWRLLPTADVPLPMGPRAVPVSQPQQF